MFASHTIHSQYSLFFDCVSPPLSFLLPPPAYPSWLWWTALHTPFLLLPNDAEWFWPLYRYYISWPISTTQTSSIGTHQSGLFQLSRHRDRQGSQFQITHTKVVVARRRLPGDGCKTGVNCLFCGLWGGARAYPQESGRDSYYKLFSSYIASGSQVCWNRQPVVRPTWPRDMAQSSPHVQFPEEVKAEERPKFKQQPTQKYDRKEIQKRLDIETWMEEQLADLFQVRLASEYRTMDNA